MSMARYTGKVAVVTGAAAGMGRSLAVELARRGARLAVCDVDADGLAETARICAGLGAVVEAEVVDVAERDVVWAFADQVVGRFGAVNYVFNNAGIAFVGSVAQVDFKDIERVLDIDFWGVVNGTKAFLPHLIASGDGHVVNTSSILGISGAPNCNAYAAAKFAVRGFTESLRQEMLATGAPVTVSCVHPGGIRTDIVKNSPADGAGAGAMLALLDRFAMTSADDAARVILRGAAKGRPRILVGLDAKVLDLSVRILGSAYQRPLVWMAKAMLPAGALS